MRLEEGVIEDGTGAAAGAASLADAAAGESPASEEDLVVDADESRACEAETAAGAGASSKGVR